MEIEEQSLGSRGESSMNVIHVNDIPSEVFPECPVCKQPIYINPVIISEPDFGMLCLAHRRCIHRESETTCETFGDTSLPKNALQVIFDCYPQDV
ncbi:hypothetical protein BS333_21525 (plasmid) [Vibrio azureus]|uniref:Uncharacterized protein n=1 Tax=Vibrio azureus NBRC 104587 TaxID=1219077 RepID=U3C474_9VIBR|nr:hypothetical protein [Vibrio azureus]AUI88963.1 hypothetical protein BS333_21525 [Vibrio azureus]GAD76229.1 hypothetical protein VAZ01S_039_00540 [Vibrio azureus NBRC 104587]